MDFVLSAATRIKTDIKTKPVMNAVNILKRDMEKVFTEGADAENYIILRTDGALSEESYRITAGESIEIAACDDLGFIYALLFISERFLGIKPFWFWMDQKIEKRDTAAVPEGVYNSPRYAVRYRGWFFNDEVLFLTWKLGESREEVWRMAFEALLRCGGNMTIPGTDKNSRLNRSLASDMGLWITHHHAEPLGAEIFARAYPDKAPNFLENGGMFRRLWEDAVKEQSGMKVIWNLCFRGQGDAPFWSSDTSGRFDTDEKRGALISSVIREQKEIVKKHVKNPVFCTNLYGEIMELYEQGFVDIDDDVIKVRADNGYGKMVTRRRDNHTARVSSMPEKGDGRQGIYYHVSFYDLQAANHITMLPNSVDFVDKELSGVLENDGDDFWIVNCSNVRPHVYYLDAIREKWLGKNISDESRSAAFAAEYYNGADEARQALLTYPKAMIKFGGNEDERAGEQFYTENARILAHSFVCGEWEGTEKLNWLFEKDTLPAQAKKLRNLTEGGMDALSAYYSDCAASSGTISGDEKKLFDATIYLQAKIHYFCANGLIALCRAIEEAEKKNYQQAFIFAGDSAEAFERANSEMRQSEEGVWQGYYYNDCFADVKHSAYMARKVMGVIRELGDNARHDKWYRETVYAPEDRRVMLLLVLDNHMTDEELYKAMKEKKYDLRS